MILSTDKTLESDIKMLLSKRKIVIAMSGSKYCYGCKITKQNIDKFVLSNPLHNLSFISIDNNEDDKLESQYYQLNEMDEYPKSVIYYGEIDNIGFKEGIITEQDLEDYNNSKRI
jgi:hypothetical protein